MDYPLNTVVGTMKGLLPEDVCQYVIKKSLEGLRAVHEKRIIHRDIKSDNILISKNGDIKLCDFGLSAQLVAE
jgi:serine/threonine protein kinase